MAAIATASWPSAKSTPIITRSRRPTAKPCFAKKPSMRPRKSGCAPPESTMTKIARRRRRATMTSRRRRRGRRRARRRRRRGGHRSSRSPVDEFAADELRRKRQNLRRRYKIQDVIQRRQVLLVQVVKEERGNKGAALTTYLSLAGRYCVLMPNTSHGGGISRKISNGADRKRLKSIMSDLKLPVDHGADRPHRGPAAHQDRDQARLRLSRAPVGRNPRAHAWQHRAGADLSRQRPDQARDPRPLPSRHRRSVRRGRRRL